MDPQTVLKNLQPHHQFLVAVDSDGCAFDSMEIKHKECFIPNFIKHFDLQPVSKYARETAEFTNLYSKWRGANRFISYLLALDLLKERPQVIARKAEIPDLPGLRAWMKRETKLGNPALAAEVEKTADPDLKRCLDWSLAVNESVADIVYNVPPFPLVRESLDKVSEWADIIVCSATPHEALVREWEEHDIARYVRFIGGQEVGSKKEMIEMALADDRYDKQKAIMIGDAPGDMKAAKSNHILYFPINPNEEEKSWELFFHQGAELFANGEYSGAYEAKLIADFEELLPESPPWK
ncbi:HAD family hydrolase [candidate division KSB1 bacterium]|nr:HAD hydrolase-like protein [candidate division KSB1 bacterium]RQW03101.1 MAG: HAD family hydrolase [candidate division KSB1 bacterium]